MLTTMASLDPLVHPHQLEVQDFDDYALVIDARSAEAYAQDRVPGAIHLPVHRASAASSPPGELPPGLAAHVRALHRPASILVYCDRGGLDSEVWARPLRRDGWQVDVLAGGWPNYRRWVDAGLERLPRVLTFRQLVGPPIGGVCRFLRVLRRRGEQVLDVASLAGQHLVPGLSVTGDRPVSQASFDGALLDALRRFDPARPVWVRCGGQLPSQLRLPPAFAEAMQRAVAMKIEAPVEERARLWRHKLRATRTPVDAVLLALGAQVPSRTASIATADVVTDWPGGPTDLLAALIEDRIDPLDARLASARPAEVVRLASLDVGTVSAVVAAWLKAPPAARGGWAQSRP